MVDAARVRPGNPDELVQQTWLLTNRLGGYAMGSMADVNTQRYHGLLIAAAQPPVDRLLALHSVFAQLVMNADDTPLSSMQFVDSANDGIVTHPDGAQRLTEIVCDPPRRIVHVWSIGRMKVRRTIALTPLRNRVEIRYDVDSGGQSCLLRLRPFTPMRNFHAIEREPAGGTSDHRIDRPDPALVRIRRGDHSLLLHLPGNTDEVMWTEDRQWWRDLGYSIDRGRGQEWIEDIWSPGTIELRVPAERAVSFDLAAELVLPMELPTGAAGEIPKASDEKARSVTRRLADAAGQFVVKRWFVGAADAASRWSTSIIAGYPWFADWGRDSMIALPGLLLATNRHDEAREVLQTFARHLRRGLIPNRFDDYGGEPHYNTVDASLWFVHAVHALPQQMRDAELIDACRSIVRAYIAGTDHGIMLDPADDLITAGSADTQLTWMDAQRDGVVFTSRHGKAIEINALFHHGLHCLTAMTSDDAEREQLLSQAQRTAASIQQRFWWDERQCCHDVLIPQAGAEADRAWQPDGRLRCNQIFAVSLEHSPLTAQQQRGVVNAVREHLLTPFGLRTLSPDHPDFQPRFEGDLFARDRAYHNGTVWPWLIGPYCEALLRVSDFNERAKSEVKAVLQPLISELDVGCIGQLAEIYDGDPPHRPDGCPAQAWSVAEVLRVLMMVS